jgi:Cys-rich protein (TIGR01571 family)
MSGIDSSDVTGAPPRATLCRPLLTRCCAATDVQAVKAYNSCTAVWNLLYMLYIPLGLGFLVYGAWRRQQMRRKFNIPGDEWADYASWLCCFPCALCQETRTLAGNEVEDGSWPAHKGNGNGEGQPLLFGTPSLGGRREAPQPNKMSV